MLDTDIKQYIFVLYIDFSGYLSKYHAYPLSPSLSSVLSTYFFFTNITYKALIFNLVEETRLEFTK